MTAPSDSFTRYSTKRLSEALADAKRLRDGARDERVRESAAEQIHLIRGELQRRSPSPRPWGTSLRLEDRSDDELCRTRDGLQCWLLGVADGPGAEQSRAVLRDQIAEIAGLLDARQEATVAS